MKIKKILIMGLSILALVGCKRPSTSSNNPSISSSELISSSQTITNSSNPSIQQNSSQTSQSSSINQGVGEQEKEFDFIRTVTFNSKAEYKAAPVKTNNLGQESTENWFDAGTITSSNLNFTGKRKYFYGAGNGALPETIDSSVVRALAGSKLNPAENTVFEIPVAVGQQHVIFAYPASLRDVTQVMYVETNDTGMKDSFTKTTVSVGGADATSSSIGSYATDYKVYSYAMAAPAAAGMTFKVTI